MNKRAGISRAPPTRAKTSAARISRGGRRSGGSDAEKDAGRCANKFVSARDNSYLYYLERGRRGGAVRLRPTMNEPLEAIALQLTPGIGSKGAAHLLEVFGDARRIFAASREELVERAELHAAPAEALVRRVAFGAAERELKHCRRAGFRAIASTDAAYPPLLREIPDYPPVLYLWGDPAVLQRRTVAVVGTARPRSTARSSAAGSSASSPSGSRGWPSRAARPTASTAPPTAPRSKRGSVRWPSRRWRCPP